MIKSLRNRVSLPGLFGAGGSERPDTDTVKQTVEEIIDDNPGWRVTLTTPRLALAPIIEFTYQDTPSGIPVQITIRPETTFRFTRLQRQITAYQVSVVTKNGYDYTQSTTTNTIDEALHNVETEIIPTRP